MIAYISLTGTVVDVIIDGKCRDRENPKGRYIVYVSSISLKLSHWARLVKIARPVLSRWNKRWKYPLQQNVESLYMTKHRATKKKKSLMKQREWKFETKMRKFATKSHRDDEV